MRRRVFWVGLLALLGVGLLAGCSARFSRRYYAVRKAQPMLVAGKQKKKVSPQKERGRNTESYDRIVENPFLAAKENPLSTFSIDVDTASYANVRRFLRRRRLPPKGAVRVEEMINYFSYRYTPPKGKTPFAVHTEVAEAPWNSKHRLVRIGIKGREIAWDKRPPSNLVFLLDVSGSMSSFNKLPLLKRSLRLLIHRLTEKDRVGIVVYAGAAGVVLPPTPGNQRKRILGALDRLSAGGSTNGGAGIKLAYRLAKKHLIPGGINRIILATDGDFNVGVSSRSSLERLVEAKAKDGVSLTVLGFGMGNYKDSTLEKLSQKGNGNYAYIDTINEARKVLVRQLAGTMITIAKDVKIQVEFNPSRVKAYRLIGYENRLLRKEDFNNDKKDAGDIGAGHTVTAFYEVVPRGQPTSLPRADRLRYQGSRHPTAAAQSPEMLYLKLRYKAPSANKSTLVTFPIIDKGQSLTEATTDFRFAAAVASFGLMLRDSKYKGDASFASILQLARQNLGGDRYGYRAEFLRLVQAAQKLKR